MNKYDITVIFAHHTNMPAESSDFPAQTLDPERIQILRVDEDDVYHPRKNSLAIIEKAEGTYTILLDEGDKFGTKFLANTIAEFEKADRRAKLKLKIQAENEANGIIETDAETESEFNPEYENETESDSDSASEAEAAAPEEPEPPITLTEEVIAELQAEFGPEPKLAFAMPALIFGGDPKATRYFSLFKTKNRTMDVSVKPRVFPIDLHGLLIPTAPLQASIARNLGKCECEKRVLIDLLRENPRFRFMNRTRLTYAVARECNAPFDIRCLTKEWYYEPFTDFMLQILKEEAENRSAAYPLIQYLALHMIRVRFFVNRDNKNKHAIPQEDVPAYVTLLTEVMQYIETEYIVAKDIKTSHSASRMRIIEMRLKKNDPYYYPDLVFENEKVLLKSDGFTFYNLLTLPVRVNLIDYEDGKLVIDGLYTDLVPEDSASIQVRFGSKLYPLTYNRRYSLLKFFGVSFARAKTFHVEIPVEDSKKERLLNFVLLAGGKEYKLDFGFPTSTSRFAKDFTYAYWRFGKYLSFWNQKGIHVVPSNKLLVLRKEIFLWMQMWKNKKGAFRDQIPMKVINFLLRPYFKKQKIWLFLDKIYKGGDSSEYMYKYAEKQKDGIKKYYLLDETAADYKRMKQEGYRPLKRGTLKHHLIFLNADLVIASNSTVFAFNDFTFDRSLAIRGDTHFQVACVQHGMSIQKIAIAQQRLRDNTRLYFCASKYEIENLSKPVYDYEGYDALKLTGVPRYDGLKDRKQKILLISPTWRMNSALAVTKSEGFARDYNPNFRETNYYKVYNSLINDPRLLDAARQHGYRIQYVLHPIISPQVEDFTKNDLVEIIPSIGNMSYEKIFCEAALMVSDYSGVQFDFAYMRKPVVYLHHNDIPQHYEEGTFHYDTMSFGEICHTNDELIDVLIRYMENDCEMPEMYRRRADDFFEYSDNNNCERIYPIMLEYTNKRKSQQV